MALYHNLGNGKFEDVTKSALGWIDCKRPAGIGCTVGDYDNDGFADVAFTSSAIIVLAPQRKERNV